MTLQGAMQLDVVETLSGRDLRKMKKTDVILSITSAIEVASPRVGRDHLMEGNMRQIREGTESLVPVGQI